MNLRKIFWSKIFASLKLNPKFKFSSQPPQKSPEDELNELIDDMILELKDPRRDVSSFQLDHSRMMKIHKRVKEEAVRELQRKKLQDPEQRLKALQEKITTRYKESLEKTGMGRKESSIPGEKKLKDGISGDEENIFESVLQSEEENDDEKLKTLKMEKEAKQSSSYAATAEAKNEENAGSASKATEKKEEDKRFDFFGETTKGLDYVPPNLVIRTLVFPKTKSEVLLLGVEKRNELHCSYMIDLMKQLKIDQIVTQIAPDEPFFIKTEDEYKVAWEKFIRGKFDYKFVINPNPRTLADLVLDPTRLKFLIDGSFLKSTSEFELGSAFFYSRRATTQQKEVDCFLTPLLYSYNNSNSGKIIPIVLNDLPVILYREMVSRTIPLKELIPLFETYLEELAKGNFNYEPTLMKPEVFIKPKIDYLTEVIKQSCFLGKRLLAVVDMNCAEQISEAWADQERLSSIENLQDLISYSTSAAKPEKNLTFTDYIHKHVILDLMMDEFVQENFVEFQSFPFSGKGTYGREMNFAHVFSIWKHYQRKYRKPRKKPGTVEDLESRSVGTSSEFEDLPELERAVKQFYKSRKIIK